MTGCPAGGFQSAPRPLEPAVLLLIEHEQRLVAQFGELGAPAGPAADRAVLEDRADDVDFLAAVDLIPQRLQDLAERRAVGVAAVHQPRDVLEADVARLQLFVVQHADAPPPGLSVPFECEIDFLDAVTLGAGAELRLRARRGAAEQDEIVLFMMLSELGARSSGARLELWWCCVPGASRPARAFSSL